MRDHLDDLRAALRQSAGPIAASLLGEPNKAMSKACQLRFGSKGSVSLELEGDSAGIWCDFSTGQGGDMLDLIIRERHCDFTGAIAIASDLLKRPIQPPVRAISGKPRAPVAHHDLVEEIWRQAVSAIGTLAETYLNGRGLQLSNDIADLRFHPSCPRGADRFPAMIAAFRDIDSNEVCGLHRTFLTPVGTKIEDRPKMMIGRVAHAAIKLSPSDQVETGLHIAEGVETALAMLNLGFPPVWALGSAGAILNFPVLAGIDCLTIGVDSDDPGRRAAAAGAVRWRAAGCEIRLMTTPTEGEDIADRARGFKL